MMPYFDETTILYLFLTSDFTPRQPNSIYYTNNYIVIKSYYPNGLIDMGILIWKIYALDYTTKYKLNPPYKHVPPPILPFTTTKSLINKLKGQYTSSWFEHRVMRN